MSPADPLRAPAQVLAANESFYTAFSQGDRARMSSLWATRATVSCAHPGMHILLGREAVLKSWNAILRAPPEVPLLCFSPRVQFLGDAAVVTCYEGAGPGPAHLAATNVFVLEAGEWKMVHHHAGPLQQPVATEPRASGLN
jgi:hypothetical protein